MSFILDALHKAEADRQGDLARVMAVPHPALRRKSPWHRRAWLWPALGISVVVALALLVREQAGPHTASGTAQTPQTTARVAPRAEPAARVTRPEVRTLSSEARLPETESAPPQPAAAAPLKPGTVEVRDLLAEEAGGAEPAVARPVPGRVEVRDLLAEESGGPETVEPGATAEIPAGITAADRAAESAPRTQAAATPSTRALAPTAPTLESLVAGGVMATPPLRLDLHVYADDPADRFVLINMRRYRSGERTKEDAVVEDITPEGAILSYRGQRFLLRP